LLKVTKGTLDKEVEELEKQKKHIEDVLGRSKSEVSRIEGVRGYKEEEEKKLIEKYEQQVQDSVGDVDAFAVLKEKVEEAKRKAVEIAETGSTFSEPEESF